jgi:hypothetical protein
METPPPSPEFLRRWVAAMESGEYLMGRGSLRTVTGEGKCKYCPLGVAADIEGDLNAQGLFVDEGGGVHTAFLDDGRYGLSDHVQSLIARLNDNSSIREGFTRTAMTVRQMWPEAFEGH